MQLLVHIRNYTFACLQSVKRLGYDSPHSYSTLRTYFNVNSVMFCSHCIHILEGMLSKTEALL